MNENSKEGYNERAQLSDVKKDSQRNQTESEGTIIEDKNTYELKGISPTKMIITSPTKTRWKDDSRNTISTNNIVTAPMYTCMHACIQCQSHACMQCQSVSE